MTSDQLSAIERISKLKTEGALTLEEFNQLKAQIITGPAKPYPPAANKLASTTRPAGLGFFQKWLIVMGAGVLVLAVALALQPSDNENPLTYQPKTESPVSDILDPGTTDGKANQYELLNTSTVGKYHNYNFIIKPDEGSPEAIKAIALTIRSRYCIESMPCNLVHMWSNKDAYELEKQYQESDEIKNNEAWKKKNWAFICESQLANYDAPSGLLDFFPLMDAEYRKYGGTKKAPSPINF